MDDTRSLGGSQRYPASKPYRAPFTGTEANGFVPLRLVLVPTGMSIDLTKPNILVGRHSSADLRLPLADVSRKHCRLVCTDGSWKIFDMDSLNGVFVNEQQVREAVLQNGDRLRLGSFIFEVSLALDVTLIKPPPDIRRAS